MTKWWDKHFRDKEIRRWAPNYSVKELAGIFKVSEPTVRRALKSKEAT